MKMAHIWIFLVLLVLVVLTTQTYTDEDKNNCIEYASNVGTFLHCLATRQKRESFDCNRCCSCKNSSCRNYCSFNCQATNCEKNCDNCNQGCGSSCRPQDAVSCQNCCSDNNCCEKPTQSDCCNKCKPEPDKEISYEAKQKDSFTELEVTTSACEDCDDDDSSAMPNIFMPHRTYPSSINFSHTDIKNINTSSHSLLENNLSLNQSYTVENRLNNTNNIYIPVFANATSINKVYVNVTYPIHAYVASHDDHLQYGNNEGHAGSKPNPILSFPMIPLSDDFFQKYPYMNPFFTSNRSFNQLDLLRLQNNSNITFESEESVLPKPEQKQMDNSNTMLKSLAGFQITPEMRLSGVQWNQTDLPRWMYGSQGSATSNTNKKTPAIFPGPALRKENYSDYFKIKNMSDCERAALLRTQFQWNSNPDETQLRPTWNGYPWYQSQMNMNRFPWGQIQLTQYPFQNVDHDFGDEGWAQYQYPNTDFQSIHPDLNEMQLSHSLIPNNYLHNVYPKLESMQFPTLEMSQMNLNGQSKLDGFQWSQTQTSDMHSQKNQPKIDGLQWSNLHSPELHTKFDDFQWPQHGLTTLGIQTNEGKLHGLHWFPGFNSLTNSSQSTILNPSQPTTTLGSSSSSNMNLNTQSNIHLNTWQKNCCFVIRPNCNYTTTPPYVECTKPTKFWTCGAQCFYSDMHGSMHRSPINCIGNYCGYIPTRNLLSEHFPSDNTFTGGIGNVPVLGTNINCQFGQCNTRCGGGLC